MPPFDQIRNAFRRGGLFDLHDWPEPGRTARLLRILEAAIRGEDRLSG